MNHSYSPSLSSEKGSGSATSGLERILWGKGIGASPPSVQFEEVMNTEEGVLKWLTKIVSDTIDLNERIILSRKSSARLLILSFLRFLGLLVQAQYGFSFVKGVPATPTDTEALIRRIAFIRETHYGQSREIEELFDSSFDKLLVSR